MDNPLHSPQVFGELQKAANYLAIKKANALSGAGSVFFGLIAVIIWFRASETNSICAGVMGVAGLLAITCGIWIMTAPSVIGMICDAVLMIILGFSSIFYPIVVKFERLEGIAEEMAFFGFIIIGTWLVIWGTQRLGRHRRFTGLPMEKPSKEAEQTLDSIREDLFKADTNEAKDVIEFQITRFFTGHEKWRGLLLPGAAVFVQYIGNGYEMVLIEKERCSIAMEETCRGRHKSSFRFGPISLKGVISNKNYHKFRSWQAAEQSHG